MIRQGMKPLLEDTAEVSKLIRRIAGVLEVAVFSNNLGHPTEIQVWTERGTPAHDIREAIRQILHGRSLMQHNERLFVFELSSRAELPAEVSPRQAPPGAGMGAVPLRQVGAYLRRMTTSRRTRITKVNLMSSDTHTRASVGLSFADQEAEGSSVGPKTEHHLQVTAATTLEAAEALIGRREVFSLSGVSLSKIFGEQIVLVMVDSNLTAGHRKLLGTSLVGGSEVYEAVVRATLDGVNRSLETSLPDSP